jgi:hypothetical protein
LKHCKKHYLLPHKQLRDAASLLPPETIDSLTSQYMSSKTFDNGDGYSHNFVEQQTRPTNLIVEEDGSVRTKR